jgi:heme/copper-type cytochrome/quinol oxidase subunit 2
MRRAMVLIPVVLLILIALFFALRPNSPAPEDSADTSESSTPETAADGQQETMVDLEIREGVMTPEEITVDEGDAVRLRITSDAPLEFHLHGYDLEEEIEPDEPAELAFDATITGRFEIENEETQEELGVLLVQPS